MERPHFFDLRSFDSILNLTIFVIRLVGSGWSMGNWIVPFDHLNGINSVLNSSIPEAVG